FRPWSDWPASATRHHIGRFTLNVGVYDWMRARPVQSRRPGGGWNQANCPGSGSPARRRG
ncbi:MAG TPA: hypothetical protein PKU91_01435, partial [Phycisphaerales bacterium]|nr:hypothetical protein [Phycisphaerales bacterium]